MSTAPLADPAVDALLDGLQDAFSRRDPGAFAPLCAEDLHYEDPFCARPLEGAAALAAHVERLWEGFPDARAEGSAQRLADGRFVVAPWRVTGTNEGELDGLPPTRRWVTLQVLLYCELDPEADAPRLWRIRAFCDRYEAAIQLGLLPKPGSVGERALLALRGFGLGPRR